MAKNRFTNIISNIFLIIASCIGIVGSLSLVIYTFEHKIPIHAQIKLAGLPGKIASIVLLVCRLFVVPMIITLTVYVIMKMQW